MINALTIGNYRSLLDLIARTPVLHHDGRDLAGELELFGETFYRPES
jgi:hypothetical protein